VASLSQGRTAAAQCGLFTHKSVPVIFEPPCTYTKCDSAPHILPDIHINTVGHELSPSVPTSAIRLSLFTASCREESGGPAAGKMRSSIERILSAVSRL